MTEWSVIAAYGDLCGEGPVWDADAGCLYWTDIDGHRFFRYDPTTKKHAVVNEGFEVAGYALNQHGGFVVVNSGGIWLWDGAGHPQLLADKTGDSKLQMNDAIADPEGRLFAGSNFFDADKNYELGKLVRVDHDGSVHVVDEGFLLANGLAFSPDERVLYFTDSAARRIYAYDYDRKSGAIRNRRIVVQVPVEEGLPDGLTVDAEGFLWSAQWYGSSIVRYDPDGMMERRMHTPAKQTSSLAFGGSDLTDMFVTSASKSWASPLMPAGYDPVAGNFGGQLYHMNPGIPGKLEYKASIRLAPGKPGVSPPSYPGQPLL